MTLLASRLAVDASGIAEGSLITGAHGILYSTDAKADRASLRELLGTPSVDAGDGWLIVALPPAEVAVHPTDGSARHELYLMCDDIEATVAELSARASRSRAASATKDGVC